MSTINQKALDYHKEHTGKLEISSKVKLEDQADLSLAYTPGVASACLEIAKDPNNAYLYTSKGNSLVIVSDGTAVLGLGDIGPAGALPVLEGKALLMKKFAGIDVFPLCLDTKDTQEIISICKAIAPGFGGLFLEDISAPRCVEIERTLIEELDIPVFHDDQHGTSIVVLAAMINAAKLIKKDPSEIKIVMSGTGAAGSSVIRMLYHYGFTKIYAFNIDGCLHPNKKDNYDFLCKELLNYVNLDKQNYASLKEAFVGADAFIGVSAGNLVNQEMVQLMNEKNIVMAMANPTPEISYEEAKAAGAYIVGTGRSDYPNQVNNLLAFPGLFRGVFDAKGTKITEDVKIAASKAIASLITDEELNPDYIIPSPFDSRVVPAIAKAVKEELERSGLVRK